MQGARVQVQGARVQVQEGSVQEGRKQGAGVQGAQGATVRNGLDILPETRIAAFSQVAHQPGRRGNGTVRQSPHLVKLGL